MTAQDKVSECFPRAEARTETACLSRFRSRFSDRKRRPGSIVSGREFDADELGRGKTETEALRDAAGLSRESGGLNFFHG